MCTEVLSHINFLCFNTGERFPLETCIFRIFRLEHFSGEELQPRVWRTPSANVPNECWAVPSSWLSSSGMWESFSKSEEVPCVTLGAAGTPQQHTPLQGAFVLQKRSFPIDLDKHMPLNQYMVSNADFLYYKASLGFGWFSGI